MPRFGHAVLGGTFDHLHVGHVALLRAAFRVGRKVSIGVTTDQYLAAHPKPDAALVQPFTVRSRALRRFLASEFSHRKWELGPLDDPFGRSVHPGVDAVIVSAETAARGELVNQERRRLGNPPIPIVVVPVVLADDLAPVSSRRIRAGEIDREGRRRAPLRFGVAADAPEVQATLLRAVRHAFRLARVFPRPAPLGRPRGAAAPRAAVLAERAISGTDLAIGVAGHPPGPWSMVLRSPTVALPARRIRVTGTVALEREVARLLRPGIKRNAFGPPRPSSH
ncbi:MAG TPA: pantetheine-phosphate adenylyltransferase [Thermoplasmata archaeon]|nr:pantetheine-phosphate adenylyltransferase [Thermoplasmata archaeon]